MPTFKTEMLVRDNSQQFLKDEGIEMSAQGLAAPDIPHALRTRLLETATDAALQDSPLELLQEFADIYEVMVTLAGLNGLSEEDLQGKVTQQREQLGGFGKGLFSQTITLPEGHEAEPFYRQHPEKFPEVKDSE